MLNSFWDKVCGQTGTSPLCLHFVYWGQRTHRNKDFLLQESGSDDDDSSSDSGSDSNGSSDSSDSGDNNENNDSGDSSSSDSDSDWMYLGEQC